MKLRSTLFAAFSFLAHSLFVGNQQDEVFAGLGAYIRVTEDRDAPLLIDLPSSENCRITPRFSNSLKTYI